MVKVFDLAIARTGLRGHEARDAGFNPRTTASSAPDHKAYYPTAHELHMRFTADADTAIFAELTIDQISDLDLSYSPPFGSPWDALQTGAQTLECKVGDRTSPSSAALRTGSRLVRQLTPRFPLRIGVCRPATCSTRRHWRG